jgi:hypothetical protein
MLPGLQQEEHDGCHMWSRNCTLPGHLSYLPPVCREVCVARSLVFYVKFCRSLFVLFLLVLSVLLWFTVSDYSFGVSPSPFVVLQQATNYHYYRTVPHSKLLEVNLLSAMGVVCIKCDALYIVLVTICLTKHN